MKRGLFFKSNLGWLVILGIVVIIAGFYLQDLPYFTNFRSIVQSKNFPSKKTLSVRNILRPTPLPFTLPPYLYDFKIGDKENIDLRQFISPLVIRIPHILNDASFKIKVGKTPGIYRITILWDAGSTNADLRLLLFDNYLKPIKSWISKKGKISDTFEIESGIYKLSLVCNGKLGKDYQFKIGAIKIKGRIEVSLKKEIIPALHIHLSASSGKKWEWLLKLARNKLLEAGGRGQPVDSLPKKGVKGFLNYANTNSAISISLCGVGFLGHFSEDNPSFTVRILSGPLFYGIERFKLYNVKVKDGLLDYVVGSLMRDEGIFVPRWMLTHVYLNKKYLGVYVLEETYSSGFFSGRDRYEGVIEGFDLIHMPRTYYKPKISMTKLPAPPPIPIERFIKSIDDAKFAKTLALITRFSATHGTQASDFRLYRNPLSGKFEPIIRDLNVDIWGEKDVGAARAFYAHSSWWFGKRLFGLGAHFNCKVYPGSNPLTAYTQTSTTLGVANVSNIVLGFIKDCNHRESFEKFLFYVSDKSFHQRFSNRLYNTFKAVSPFLKESNKHWIENQVKTYTNKEFIVPKILPSLLKNNYLLIKEKDISESFDKKNNFSTFILYNLSPFSISINLPDYASLIAPDKMNEENPHSRDCCLSSSLFYTLIHLSPLNKENTARLIQIEKLRYFSKQPYVSPKDSPIIELRVPIDRRKDFLNAITDNSLVLGGTFYLPKDKVIFYSDLPSRNSSNQQIVSNFTSQLIVFPLDAIPISNGYMLRYLLSNNSLYDITIDLSKIHVTCGEHKRGFICDVVPTDAASRIQRKSKVTAWEIHNNWNKTQKQKLTLGASSKVSKSSFFWTGSFLGILNGPENPKDSNIALLQIEVPAVNHTLFYITDPKVLNDSILSPNNLQIVVNENCTNILYSHSLHKKWTGNKSIDRSYCLDSSLFDVESNSGKSFRKVSFKKKINTISSLIIIPKGYLLEINPGTVLYFKKGGGILSFSPIEAVGNEREPIVFMPDKKDFSWLGIAVVAAPQKSKMSYIKISGARGGEMNSYYFSGGVNVVNSYIELNHFEIQNFSSEDALHLYKSYFSIKSLKIENVKDDGVDCDWSYGKIENSDFSFVGGDGIDLSNSLVKISRCALKNAKDKGVSVGENSLAYLFLNDISKNNIGVAIKDQSEVSIKKCYFANNKIGISLYIKKPNYIYPSFNIKNCKYVNNRKNIFYGDSDACTWEFN